MRIAVGAGVIALAAGAAIGQTAQQTSGPPAFEVSSIRLHVGPAPGVGINVSGSRLTATNNSVLSLITYAYSMKLYQVTGGPGWVSDYASSAWDIAAKAEGDSPLTQERAQQMMQTLLADRFKLTFHREMRETPVYALVVAGKGGPTLKKSEPDAASTMYISGKWTERMTATKWTMEQLAANISNSGDRPVLDRTGLTGTYDFTLEWNPAYGTPNPDPDAPSIFTALQEQLGLKLEPQKAPVEVFAIDHAEKPSEN